MKIKNYTLDETIFDKIDNSEKSYWLGFLWADCSFDRNSITLDLAIKDIEILVKFKKFLKLTNNIKLTTRNYKNKITQSARIYFNSKNIANQLEKFGFRKKTKNGKFNYSYLPEKFFKSFLLGFSDGDGTVYYNESKKRACWKIVLHEQMLNYVIKNIKKNCNLERCTLTIKNHWRTPYIKQIYINGNRNVKTFLEWLYFEENVFLERKYQKFILIKNNLCSFNNRKRKNSKSITQSIFRGVTKAKKGFTSHITKNSKQYYLGTFNSEKEAAIAYNKKALELFGKKAILNYFNES